MSIDDVTDITPRRQYTAAVAQEEFDYPFPIFAESDLVVDVDGIIRSDYTVSGVGDDTGGTVTFDDPLDGGEVVTLWRDTTIERTTDYSTGGPFTAARINDELDRLVLIDQEQDSKIGRAIRFPLNSTQGDAELSPIANWFERFIFINASGELEPAAAISFTTLTQSIIGLLLTPLTDAEVAASLSNADITRPWRKAGHIERYNADPSGAASAVAAINKALSQWRNGGDMPRAGAGTYMVDSQIDYQTTSTDVFTKGFAMIGEGVFSTFFDNRVAAGFLFDIDTSAANKFQLDLTISGFSIKTTTSPATSGGIRVKSVYNLLMEKLHIKGLTGSGLVVLVASGDTDASNMPSLKHVRIEDCAGWGINYDSTGHNEASFTRWEHVFVQNCGTDSATYPAIPSGGAKWKGQVLLTDSCAFVINKNVGWWIEGGAGLANAATMINTTVENNRKIGWLTTGCIGVKTINLQVYSNELQAGGTETNGVLIDGTNFVCSHMDFELSTVRATAEENPYTAFKVTGANADTQTIRVRKTYWKQFDFTGQVRFDGVVFDGVAHQCDLVALAANNLVLRPSAARGRGNKMPFRIRGAGSVPATAGEWVELQIASGGLSISNAGLANSTTYAVYLYDNANVPSLELSTTMPATDASTGYPVKTGDATRYFVGKTRTDGSAQFLTASTGWLNPEISTNGRQTGAAVYRWYDNTDRQRVTYAAEPVSDTDGALIGTQS